jgi:hypothetical protein
MSSINTVFRPCTCIYMCSRPVYLLCLQFKMQIISHHLNFIREIYAVRANRSISRVVMQAFPCRSAAPECIGYLKQADRNGIAPCLPPSLPPDVLYRPSKLKTTFLFLGWTIMYDAYKALQSERS